ncbi:MAG: LON peptidase substrate-binding domain-containing protein [Hymenobacteraceae bacterium]|nr:LON peptidase substrate-binding domain-containing protein [Hymenobacteraceae bacterium]MDX5397831.1 LON peptidase substrate-binding domain-containing protein [Hymenobacteraceae bacterium]MDX5443973.1 LON peptidase substrate-binding domain-containing protein [Hymenobacteraceae bacterium]MDX5513908.1 LON peptidase substrate-binding domain-containing protein [Hymenobacteraceae bacterium]
MSKLIPLFPLNIVVFPGEKLNLHIFEPRYKQLIKECFENESNFGIPTYLNDGVGMFGTEIKIKSIDKNYPGGEMDIRTEGVGIFKIEEFIKEVEDKPYAAGKVEEIELKDDEDILVKEKIRERIKELYEALGISNLFIALPDNFKSFDIAHHLGLSVEQEYQLLQCQNESDRQELILQHLDKVVPIVVQTEKLKERVKQNGHFKHLNPPNF